jgi:hypothetical protein
VTVEGVRLQRGAAARLDLARLIDNLETWRTNSVMRRPDQPDLRKRPVEDGSSTGRPGGDSVRLPPPRLSPLASVPALLLVLMLSIRPGLQPALPAWFPAMACLAYACWLEDLPSHPRVIPVAAAAMFCAALALNLATTLNYNRVSLDRFGLMLERPLWERQAALLKLNMPSEYEHAILFAPAGEPLGYNVGSDGFVYPLYKADFSQRLTYVPVSEADDCPSLAARMRERGTRYLFVAESHTPGEVIQRVRDCAQGGGSLAEESRGLYVIDAGS